jgi:hypothetical protein
MYQYFSIKELANHIKLNQLPFFEIFLPIDARVFLLNVLKSNGYA